MTSPETDFFTVVEQCGALVDAGLLDHGAAIRRVRAAAPGTPSVHGAAQALADWQTIRAHHGDLLMSVEMLIATCEHAQRTDIPVDVNSMRSLLRESARRGAWHMINGRRGTEPL